MAASLGCSDANVPPVNESSQHVQYFGFTLVDTAWDDPTDTDNTTNYKDEVAPFTNIADILVVTPTDDIRARIDAFDALGLTAILHLHEIFFELVGTDGPSGANYSLRPNYRERWDTLVATNALPGNASKLGALYIGEEPTWNGVAATDLAQATDYAKATLPDVPIMVVEASPILAELQVPASVDWVGFDHYFVRDPLNDPQFQSELMTLKSKLSTEDQRLVFILDSHYIEAAHLGFGAIPIADMDVVAQSYFDLTQQELNTVALLGYFWPNGFDGASTIGARSMPEHVLNAYRDFGQRIAHD